MTRALVFREATPADVPAIVALVQSAYRGEPSRAGWTTEADLLDGQRTDADDVRACIAQSGSIVLLAEQAGALVACAHVSAQGETAWFGMFAVRPTLQGHGVGKAVLAEAERFARATWHATAMRMTVIAQRAELLAFYERRGFVRTGLAKPFPYGEPRFGVPRRDDLRFEILEKPLDA